MIKDDNEMLVRSDKRTHYLFIKCMPFEYTEYTEKLG